MYKPFCLFPIPMQPSRQIIIDTGPLVLLALSRFFEGVGSPLNESLTRNFTPEQLERLEISLAKAQMVLLSPYCLAESTNLIQRPDQRLVLARIAESFKPCRVDTADVLQDPRFPRLGAADVSLLLLAQQSGTYTLTADRELYTALCNAEFHVVYFCVEQGNQHIVAHPEG